MEMDNWIQDKLSLFFIQFTHLEHYFAHLVHYPYNNIYLMS